MNLPTEKTLTSTTAEWGPFERPLFDSPEARALQRVGVVDVGSNSVRLVVFDGAARSPAYFYNEKIMCGLGAGLHETGRLNPEGRERALAALKRFRHLAETMDLPPLTTIATAAMRNATDGPEFKALLERETGLVVHVIDGAEEARLSAQGVLLGWPGAYGLVCDIGGSSMELAEISGGRVGKRVTSDLGPLKMQAFAGKASVRGAHIAKTLAALTDELGPQRDRLFLVGGSWRALAKVDMQRRKYPLRVLHEYRMTRDDLKKTVGYILRHKDHDALRAACGVSAGRMKLLPYAAEVLRKVVETFQPEDIAVSSYGIREGLLYEQMPEKLRARDPLIEACRFIEAKDARQPGEGRRIFEFIRPLFGDASWDRLRLIKAACLLHDVSWRAHPDYRAEVCFDNATRANLGGLRHWERVYLGLALLHRYSNKRQGTRFDSMAGLLTPEQLQEAETLGKALRFAAMLWTRQDHRRGIFEWDPAEARLELHLAPEARNLFGEVSEARLKSLASSMNATLAINQLD